MYIFFNPQNKARSGQKEIRPQIIKYENMKQI